VVKTKTHEIIMYPTAPNNNYLATLVCDHLTIRTSK
jgi:hypothetical protein